MKKKRRIPTVYDYENTFDEDISLADEKQIERLLKEGKIKQAYATKTITSGKITEIEIYPEFTRKQMKIDQSIKKKTRLSQKNLNERNSKKHLIRLINTNFNDGDIWATFTYTDDNLPNTMEDAIKNMQYYIRKLNRIRKKKGLGNARYIYITEFSKKKKIRVHHHLIIDGDLDLDTIEKTWTKGRRNNVRRLKSDDRGLTGLASYFAKDPKGHRRYNASKGLKKPKVRKNHQSFSMKKIRQMIEDNRRIKEFIEKKYPGFTYVQDEARYNKFNKRTYFYIMLSSP